MINNILPLLLIVFIFGSPALSAELNRPSEWAVPLQLSGVPNLYKINNNLYRSAQPTKQGMNNLNSIGIKTIINLRVFHSDTDEARNTGLLVEELSVKNWHIEDEDVIRVLRIIRQKENGPFLIHCQHGADRTGVMSAMYRIVEQGWSKKEAIREMVDGGYGFHAIWSNTIGYVKNVDTEKFKKEIAWLPEKPVQATRPLPWEIGAAKSYLIPALEIPTFLFLLNMYDRLAYPNEVEDGEKTFSTNFSTFWENLVHRPWVVDHDTFSVNQFAHPYQGSMHHGFARSAGLNYWESLLYANVGSFLWEMCGETTSPSINDQIATGTGGSFLGEVLFRMAGLVLEGDGDKPGILREFGAAIISPPTGINRFVFGDRFKPVFPSHHPATFYSMQFGTGLNTGLNDEDVSSNINRYEAIMDFSMAYGLPGKPGYHYERPFDYFNFEFTGRGNSDNPLDSIMIRGLLLGSDYAVGKSYRGIWGLYGCYDYISPHIFPVSSTAVSLGTTFQWWLSQTIALQGSVLGGIGYAATGNITEVHQRDYHYGFTPQGLLALRLILGDRAMLDFTGRSYRLTGMGGDDKERTESIDHLKMGFTVRIYDRHALGIQYIASIREQRYPDRSDSHQTVGTVSLVYTWLGNARFGAVEWRGAEDH